MESLAVLEMIETMNKIQTTQCLKRDNGNTDKAMRTMRATKKIIKRKILFQQYPFFCQISMFF